MNGELWGAFLRLLIALPLTLLLAYGALKFLLPRRFPLASGRRMRLVEQLPLGPKAGLWLVQVGEKYYLLAHHDGAITTVREYEELPPAVGAETVEALAGLAGWRERLGCRRVKGTCPDRLFGGFGRRGSSPAGTEETGRHGR